MAQELIREIRVNSQVRVDYLNVSDIWREYNNLCDSER